MKIVVAQGGVSPEREVSLASGAAVAEALARAGFETTLYDVKSVPDFIGNWPELSADGVFIALHGGWGEDGRFQACLEAFGIPYTGSGSEACMLAMDKTVAKQIFTANKIPTPRGMLKRRGSSCGSREIAMLEEYGRLIVKPNSAGSTVGVAQATSLDELGLALEAAWRIEEMAIIEEYVQGREITIAVWERTDGETVPLPAIDIRPKDGFYDYRHKYTAGETEYLCPAPLSPEMERLLSQLAVEAHNSLGCRSYSRVDFRVTEGDDVRVLEINTAPGMTATSLVPKAAAAAGVSFPDFLKSVVEMSFPIDRRF